jgi:hypothetical protein
MILNLMKPYQSAVFAPLKQQADSLPSHFVKGGEAAFVTALWA